MKTERILSYARELQRATTFPDLLEITQREVAATGYAHAWLFVADDDTGETWRLIDSRGTNRELLWARAPVLRLENDPMLAEILASTKPVVVDDAQTDPRTNKALANEFGSRTLINVPLRLLDRAIGAFGTGTFRDEGVRPPTPEQVAHLAAMAEQLAVAAGRIRFLGELEASRAAEKASADRLGVLARSTRWFSSLTGDIQELLDAIVATLGQEIGDGATLQLLADDTRPAMFAVYEPDPEYRHFLQTMLHDQQLANGDGITGKVAKSGQSLLIPVITREELLAAEHPPFLRQIIERNGAWSLLAVPLHQRGELTGVLGLRRRAPSAPYTVDDQRLAEDLADRAALAIENTTLVTQLERRVEARTRELEMANRDLEAFSYSVAHDLRAPLRAMGHFAVAILEDYGDRLDNVGRDYLARIQRGGDQMQAIIEALLSLGRLTKKDLVREPVDLAEIADAVVGPLADAQPGRTVDVVIHKGMDVVGDPVLLRALYENLIGNAWKFTRHRDRARIEVGEELGEGERVFYVRDNGAGFDQAFVEKLFAPFQRLHAATEFEGTGIGLATAHKIVTRHGGRIWAEGATGEGATLRFTLRA